jgi:hypothetical protein
MKSLTIWTVCYFVASTLTSVSAESVNIIIRTTLQFPEPPPPSQALAIDAAMKDISPALDEIVINVAGNVTVPPVRYLRDNERKLACIKCGSVAQFCYIFPGIQVDNCSTRRSLTIHEELSEESIAELNEDARSRHLQVSQLCREARVGIRSAINEAGNDGIVPVPDNVKIIEECFYEYV